jgi:rod shape-determining protein MreC
MMLMGLGLLLVFANAKGWLGPGKTVVMALMQPAARAFGGAGSGLGSWMDTVGNLRNLASDNFRLEREVAELRQRLSEDAELRQQNEALKKQLSFSEAQPKKLIPAEVIGYQPDNFRQFITVRQGSQHGIAVGMAVISEGSLVGKVSDVTATTAKVFLVTDPNFRVNGMAQEGRALGTVRGQIGSGFIMEKIAQNESIKPGETIVTSGLGGEVPKGLIIGRVESVNQRDNAVFQSAQLTSSIKFSRLELVFVVAEL